MGLDVTIVNEDGDEVDHWGISGGFQGIAEELGLLGTLWPRDESRNNRPTEEVGAAIMAGIGRFGDQWDLMFDEYGACIDYFIRTLCHIAGECVVSPGCTVNFSY